MKIIKEISMENFEAWSGAVETLETIKEHGKIKELEYLIQKEFFRKPPTETQINDFLWFDDEYIFEVLNIKE